ncbi:MAG: ABC transporter permease, partial [Clostridia bacterium]|nr:ABC transporter permease [Clostridia bacterium]
MFKYILKRIVIAIVILFFVSIILYILLRCMPVDYIESKLANLSQVNEDQLENLRQTMLSAYGLNNGVIGGYFQWLGNIFQGNFGNSFVTGAPVLSDIFAADKIGTSFFVAAVSTVFEFLIAIPLGITAATHQYAVRDYVVTILVLIGISLPSFFFGQILKYLFANQLGWFEVSGMHSAGSYMDMNWIERVGDYLWHMVLPILTVVILSLGGRMRMT